MQLPDDKIKEILLQQNYVTPEDLEKADSYAREHRSNFLQYLVETQIINRILLGQAIAEYFQIPFIDLSTHQPARESVALIPEAVAKKYRVFLFSLDQENITVVTDNPDQPEIAQELQKLFPSQRITIAFALPEDIDGLFIHYRRPLQTRFLEIIKAQQRVAPEILEEILQDTLAHHASDIHFEPQDEDVVIRFRIDGVLHEAGTLAKEYYDNILNRIKVQANLRIDEHTACQDGAIRMTRDHLPLDLRVSITPTLNGEKVAIRLLAHYIRGFGINNLGLSPKHEKMLMDAIKKPFGMILVTGPTGSGKTTTLYALLKIVNRPEVNITTIEDPVEYKIAAINQIQVNPEANITFASGLRSIARQDPDIILVGEIRDKETADIAVNAALTGHLLLSTFHSNDAATAIPRLMDMGVEPFLVASSMELIIAQRLVRKICENCRYSVQETVENIEKLVPDAKKYFPEPAITLYRGKGCGNCNNSGYKGRTALFEFMHITPEMQDLILKNPSIKQIWALARRQGAASLFEDGIEKVKNGITSLEELLRIATPPSS